MSENSVPLHKFKARLSYYLASLRGGRTLTITSHRKVIARVSGVPPSNSEGVARLLASGEASWSGGKPVGTDLRLSAGGPEVSHLVLEQRG